jgi:hypothetical protein
MLQLKKIKGAHTELIGTGPKQVQFLMSLQYILMEQSSADTA